MVINIKLLYINTIALTERGNPWDVAPLDPADIPRMRVSGRIAREVLDEAVRAVKVMHTHFSFIV